MEDSAKAVEIMQQMQGIITSQSESMQDTQRTYDATQEAAGAFEQVSTSAGRLREIADKLVKSIEYFKL